MKKFSKRMARQSAPKPGPFRRLRMHSNQPKVCSKLTLGWFDCNSDERELNIPAFEPTEG